ncbi:MAG: hypothetical protein KVP17_001278 [Porospora cf. gigantea B]|uniref:uncharacterized protein n=2 Tax=Porospora cf. gigantea B TaxID=2853592 RepID=UPI003571B62C|nr:MAG: hypothetical protein KVP17_001278 [Porospora cf. gigantea B]
MSGPTSKVSLVVPCTAADGIFIPRLLESVRNQTLAPMEIILVVSPDTFRHVELDLFGSPSALRSMIEPRWLDKPPPSNKGGSFRHRSDHETLLDLLSYVEGASDVDLYQVPGLRVIIADGHRFAGAARKLGVDVAKGDVVSFFDVDDYMHPRRIEIIDRVFRERGDLEAFLHGFLMCYVYECADRMKEWEQSLKRIPVWDQDPDLAEVLAREP